MKPVFLILIVSMLLSSCTEQKQEQSQITNEYAIELPNFNTAPWSTISKIDYIGDVKIEAMKKEFENGQFKNGKDFEERMDGKLSDDMIGEIGERFKFEVVE